MDIRIANSADLPALARVAAAMGAAHEGGYFEKCLEEQSARRRDFFVAEAPGGSGSLAGYAMINWSPLYLPFRRLGIPEVQDLSVTPECRRQGVGQRLVEACESAARSAGKTEIGISVGLYAAFGQAQRLYVRMGYVPDGTGIAYDEETVRAGELRAVDDLLTLKLVKTLLP